ncbi:MAG: DUF2339 domain-containing protein [Elusimicrobiota bacterium]|jgi:uncharacterized membrane protein|nr:DUF2339 domain-containing protein [Elusimicrobiota bacterium]
MGAIVLIILGIIGFIFVIPIILFIKISNINDDIYALRSEIDELKGQIKRPDLALREKQPEIKPQAVSESAANAAETQTMREAVDMPRQESQPAVSKEPAVILAEQTLQKDISVSTQTAAHEDTVAREESSESSYFENVTAGKIFSWIGGFMLFLGIIFAVKYSVENNLISPQARLISGVLFSFFLIAFSFFVKDEQYKTTADTLCGAGLAILYGVIFSAKYFYNFLSATSAFSLMTLVSFASFGLAVFRNAQYIGYLGVITGFLTPLILNTGSHNYLMLFAYLAFINAGAISAGIAKRWDKLICVSLIFTFLFQIVWFYPWFSADKLWDFIIVFCAYAAACAFACFRFRDTLSRFAKQSFSAYILGSFLFIFLTNMSLPAIGLAFFINVLTAALFYLEPEVYNPYFKTVSIAAFLLLAYWFGGVAGKEQNGIILLLSTLCFSALNTVVGMAKRVEGDTISAFLPVAALLLLFIIPFNNAILLSFFAVIFAASAIAASIACGSVWTGWAALIILSAFFIRGIFSVNLHIGFAEVLFSSVFYTAFFGLIFIGAKRFADKIPSKNGGGLAEGAVIMPYIVLACALLQNGISPVLTLSFCGGITAIILFVSYIAKSSGVVLFALGGSFFTQIVYVPSAALFGSAVLIEILIFIMFFAYPFFEEDADNARWPAAALAGIALIFNCIFKFNLAHDYAGALNLTWISAFAAFLYGVTIALVFDKNKMPQPAYGRKISWLGTAFFFAVTVILCNEIKFFWLPMAIALEGGAILWLYSEFRQKWAYWAGFALLVASFAVLMLNLFSIEYTGAENKIFNNLLLIYGVSAAAMYFGSLKADEYSRSAGNNVSGLLAAFSWITLFALINAEIAFYFADAGKISFLSAGNFSKTVAYTLAWGIYGMLTLFGSIGGKKALAGAYAGIGLVIIALLKLFLSDVWMLSTLYRIIIFVGMAVILIAGSFFYQALTGIYKDKQV